MYCTFYEYILGIQQLYPREPHRSGTGTRTTVYWKMYGVLETEAEKSL